MRDMTIPKFDLENPGSRSQSECDILLNHITFIACQSALPFHWHACFKIRPCKFVVKVIVQGPISYQLTSPSCHGNLPSHWDICFFLNILPWKSKVKVQDQIVCPTSYQLTNPSFHVNWPSHSRDSAISNLTLKIPAPGHSSRSHILLTHIIFIACQLTVPIFEIVISNFDLEKSWSRSK